MAAYAAIIAKIDEAIENWAGEPVQISEGTMSLTYRSIDDLIKARKYYASLAAAANRGGRGFSITKLRAGGTRG